LLHNILLKYIILSVLPVLPHCIWGREMLVISSVSQSVSGRVGGGRWAVGGVWWVDLALTMSGNDNNN